jgi:simple sugar transport system permease protein
MVDRITAAFDVRKGKRDPEAISLSGGNLQKFVVGREILREPAVLVVSQPTWGVDAGATAAIRQALIDLASRGSAVLVISQDLDELFEIADRIAVIFHGTLSAPLEAAPTTSWRRRRAMRLVLERRPERSVRIAIASPLIAIAFTLATMAILFALLGKNPLAALAVYFIDPLTDAYTLQEIAVKATPLVMIAVGLSVCYIANVWNIGAEGQFIIGAVAGSWLAVRTQGTDAGAWVLPAMLLLGALGGALYAMIPAVCRVRFGASEILVSLMLVYVADLMMDYLVRGPWRDPHGLNFPTTAEFDPVATVPALIDGSRLHAGAILALIVVLLAGVLLGRTLKGFEIRVVGAAPKAAAFAGFDARRLVLFCFAVSGALAGLAGIIEVAGPIGHLQPGISPGYGFTAIIVAFLGRLNPFGVLVAGLFLALTFIGGEGAQIALKVPLDLTKVFQGILLFYVLACDSLILYRIRLVAAPGRPAQGRV